MATSSNGAGIDYSGAAHLIFHAKAAHTPNHLPTFMGGHGRNSHNLGEPVQVDHRQRLVIWQAYRNNVSLSTALDRFLQYVTMGGVDVEVSVNGHAYELNGENTLLQEYVSRELRPQIDLVLRDLLLYGYTRIMLVPSAVDETLPSFVVLEEGLTTESFILDQYARRSYQMVFSQTSGTHEERSVPNGMLFFMDHPDHTGILTSPVACCMSTLQYQEKLWEHYMRSALRGSMPPYVFVPESKADSTLDGGGPLASSVMSAEAALEGSARTHDAHMRSLSDAQRAAYERAINVVHSIRNAHLHGALSSDGTSSDRDGGLAGIPPRAPVGGFASSSTSASYQFAPELERLEQEIPWQFGTVAATNQRLQAQQRVQAPDHIVDMELRLARMVATKIGIPPEMVSSSHEMHSANVDAMHHQLRTNVHAFQGRARSILESLLRHVWAPLLAGSMRTHKADSASTSDKSRRKKENSDSDSTEDRRRKRARTRQRRSDDEEDESEYTSDDSSESELYSDRARTENAELGSTCITDLRRVQVKVEFTHNPSIVSYDLLKRLYDDGVIHAEAFQEFALGTAGMNQEARLENMEEALRQRHEQTQEGDTRSKSDTSSATRRSSATSVEKTTRPVNSERN